MIVLPVIAPTVAIPSTFGLEVGLTMRPMQREKVKRLSEIAMELACIPIVWRVASVKETLNSRGTM